MTDDCKCLKCQWDRECPIYAHLADETVRAQGWGPSFAMVWLDIPALWHGDRWAWADARWAQGGEVLAW